MTRPDKFRILRVACMAAVLPVLSPAQEPAEAPPESPETTRDYAADAEAVRAAFLAAFEAKGLVLDPATEADTRPGELITAYAKFGPDDFGRDVALPAPQVSRTYPFLQPRRLGTGTYRMRALLQAGENGLHLKLTAEIRAKAFNRVTYEHQEIQRESNGVIERYFHNRIEVQLNPQTPSDVRED